MSEIPPWLDRVATMLGGGIIGGMMTAYVTRRGQDKIASSGDADREQKYALMVPPLIEQIQKLGAEAVELRATVAANKAQIEALTTTVNQYTARMTEYDTLAERVKQCENDRAQLHAEVERLKVEITLYQRRGGLPGEPLS